MATRSASIMDTGSPGAIPKAPLLEIEDLHVEFRTRDGVAKVLNGVSYHVEAGETLAVLGESGSGKSVTAQTIMGILDMPPAVITGGALRHHREGLLALSEGKRRPIRRQGPPVIFPDPLLAPHPAVTAG